VAVCNELESGKHLAAPTLILSTTASVLRDHTMALSHCRLSFIKLNPMLTHHFLIPAAKAALLRKKAHEKTLEQTSASMMTVEREISSIETANINKETLTAITNASKAMKQIHGGLTVDKVDQTMYVHIRVLFATSSSLDKHSRHVC
jgi:hypothetical protein